MAKYPIQSRSRYLPDKLHPNKTEDREEILKALEVRLLECFVHISRVLFSHSDIDWSVLKKEGTHRLFNIDIDICRDKWDINLQLNTTANFIDLDNNTE